jgi:hypothetical protein
MVELNPFLQPGSWYKGALHVHTTRSDGRLSPLESMEFHRAHGYAFLVITDHDVVTDISEQSTPDFLNIPGVEVSYGRNEIGQSYHVVLAGVEQGAQVRPSFGRPLQEVIDRWQALAQLVFLAHPYWSGMILAEMLPLERLAGIEIFNTSSQTDLGKGLATVHWDDLLARGKHWYGFGVDDTHGVNDDAAGGWVVVRSESLTREAILQALNRGAFYSSSGPQILDFGIRDGVARVSCSEVVTINFIGMHQFGFQRRAAPGATIVDAEWPVDPRCRYLRVECVDGNGHAAWTNPLYI